MESSGSTEAAEAADFFLRLRLGEVIDGLGSSLVVWGGEAGVPV